MAFLKMNKASVALLLSGLLIAVAACSEGAARFSPEIPTLPVFAEDMDVDLFWIPQDNQQTREKVALGWQLFYDTRLSADESLSCASCHLPDAGFADPRAGSVGIDGQIGGRNAPTVINSMFSELLFWDGRAASLEEQALGPIMNPIEMGNTVPRLEERLNGIPGYREQFKNVFDADIITAELVAKAIAAFERTVVSMNSSWDKFRDSDDASLISESALRGKELFDDKAACQQCHVVTRVDDLPEELFQNTGIAMDAPEPDLGRFTESGEERDRGAFKMPALRNVSQTAPYMHDGSLETLEDVVRFYDKGGDENPWLDEDMKPLNLSDDEIQDLLAFLESLTGDLPEFTQRVPALPPDM